MCLLCCFVLKYNKYHMFASDIVKLFTLLGNIYGKKHISNYFLILDNDVQQ